MVKVPLIENTVTCRCTPSLQIHKHPWTQEGCVDNMLNFIQQSNIYSLFNLPKSLFLDPWKTLENSTLNASQHRLAMAEL